MVIFGCMALDNGDGKWYYGGGDDIQKEWLSYEGCKEEEKMDLMENPKEKQKWKKLVKQHI